MNTRTTQTAAETYAAKQAEIAQMIATLQAHLVKHEARAKAAPRNWGYAGDLGYIAEQLKNTIDFINGNPA